MNIYKQAREIAGLTQEELSEKISLLPGDNQLSVDSIRDYETDKTIPGIKRVRQMCEVYGNESLMYQHMQNNGFEKLLPKLEFMGIQGATLTFIAELQDVQERLPRLIEIVADGKIDNSETEEYKQFLKDAQDLFKPLVELLFASH